MVQYGAGCLFKVAYNVLQLGFSAELTDKLI